MKRFQVVVVGCGGMANSWVEYATRRSHDTAIVGLVDIHPGPAEKMAERHGLDVPIFTDLEVALEQLPANLVFDVTIPDSHPTVVKTALGRGCDVMGEKPMATSLQAALEMLECARDSGKSYAVMQNRRYNPQIRSFRSIVRDKIGTPTFVNADFFLGPHFGGFRDAMESPLIVDMAIHTFDQARFITAADAVSVYCHEFNPAGSWYEGNAAAVCIFEMSDGSVFCYRGSWCAEGAPTSWESSWRVVGSHGTAMWDGTNLPWYEDIVPTDGQTFLNTYERRTPEPTWQGQQGHFGCLDEMFTALLEEREAETHCTDNIKTMKMVFGALESARSGAKVWL